jgi:predicted ester cyclase
MHYAELPEPLHGRETWLHGFELMRAATGRTIDYVSHEFYRVEDGLFLEEWICSDIASLFRQLS